MARDRPAHPGTRLPPKNNDIPVKMPLTSLDALRTIAVSRIYLDN